MTDDRFHRQLLDQLSECVYVVDRERRITFWNRAAERLTGYPAAEVVGTLCPQGVLRHVDADGNALCGDRCPLLATIADGTRHEAEVLLHHAEGHRVPVMVAASPLYDDAGNIIGAVESFRDNTPKMEILSRVRELEGMAYIDALTGLGNRRCTMSVLEGRLDELKRYGWGFGLLFIDVDDFRDFNNRWGHTVGDRALVLVSRSLMASLRQSDFAGRWGGDELLAVIGNVDRAGLRRAAERFVALLGASSLTAGGETLPLTVSIGATLAEHVDTAEGLVQVADQLMYCSKEAGSGQITVGLPRSVE